MQTAGRFLAEERGAFEAEIQAENDAPDRMATAPVIETVLLHMGREEFRRFMCWYGDLN